MKEIILQKRDYNICWIFNIGVEKYWQKDNFEIKNIDEDKCVMSMEQIMLFIASEKDYVVLREMPDKDYLQKVMDLKGEKCPTILVPKENDYSKSITELILDDQDMLNKLRCYSGCNKMFLMPYGITFYEEKLSRLCNIQLIGTSSYIAKKTNSKVYVKSLLQKLNENYPVYYKCENIKMLEDRYYEIHRLFDKVVVKKPYGASGRGLYLIKNERNLSRNLKMIERINGDKGIWLIEGWYDNKKDYNFQLYIHNSGNIEIFGYNEQILEETVYRGTNYCVNVSTKKTEKYMKSMKRMGGELYDEGVRGVVGIDAIEVYGKELFIVEINARFTLSTYLIPLVYLYPNKCIMTMYYRIILNKNDEYTRILNLLCNHGILFNKEKMEGVFIYNKSCFNRMEGDIGRVFFLYIANDQFMLKKMMKTVENILCKEGHYVSRINY